MQSKPSAQHDLVSRLLEACEDAFCGGTDVSDITAAVSAIHSWMLLKTIGLDALPAFYESEAAAARAELAGLDRPRPILSVVR